MRSARYWKVSSIVAVLTACTMLGCSSYYWPFPPHQSPVNDGWGDAYESNIAKMTANPDAGQVGEPIALDGSTGELVTQGYYESQKTNADDDGLSSLIRIESGN
jgi:hypothetical protein